MITGIHKIELDGDLMGVIAVKVLNVNHSLIFRIYRLLCSIYHFKEYWEEKKMILYDYWNL